MKCETENLEPTDLLGHDAVGFLHSTIHLSTIEQHHNKLLSE